MRSVAPAGATSAASKNWARTCAVLMSPLRGLSNTMGPRPHGSRRGLDDAARYAGWPRGLWMTGVAYGGLRMTGEELTAGS
jgi:hypothetical protein